MELSKVFDWQEDAPCPTNPKLQAKPEPEPIILDFEQVKINHRSFKEYIYTKKRLLETYLNIQREEVTLLTVKLFILEINSRHILSREERRYILHSEGNSADQSLPGVIL